MQHTTLSVSAQDHLRGDKSAAVSLIEYGDYECGYCGQAHPIIKRLEQTYAAKLNFVFRNFGKYALCIVVP